MTTEMDALPESVRAAIAAVKKLERENESLAARVRELDDSLDRTMAERDAAQDALADTHIALGGDGEWVARMPQPNPPDSGDLVLDVPVLASEVLARAEKAESRVQELERSVEAKS